LELMHAIFYNGPVNAGGMRNTQQALADAVARGQQDIAMVLTSNGGDVAWGMVVAIADLKLAPVDTTAIVAIPK
jgi:ATP-dependent protease ClpP protease subunit